MKTENFPIRSALRSPSIKFLNLIDPFSSENLRAAATPKSKNIYTFNLYPDEIENFEGPIWYFLIFREKEGDCFSCAFDHGKLKEILESRDDLLHKQGSKRFRYSLSINIKNHSPFSLHGLYNANDKLLDAWKVDRYFVSYDGMKFILESEPYTIHYNEDDHLLQQIQRYELDHETSRSTQIKQEILTRIGQGLFRKVLLDYWQGACSVTGLDEPALLRASHMKPWKNSDDNERLSVYNGLLLAPHLDALFDRGFISFDDSGRIIFSNRMNQTQREQLNLNSDMCIRTPLEAKHKEFLEYHRKNILRPSGLHYS